MKKAVVWILFLILIAGAFIMFTAKRQQNAVNNINQCINNLNFEDAEAIIESNDDILSACDKDLFDKKINFLRSIGTVFIIKNFKIQKTWDRLSELITDYKILLAEDTKTKAEDLGVSEALNKMKEEFDKVLSSFDTNIDEVSKLFGKSYFERKPYLEKNNKVIAKQIKMRKKAELERKRIEAEKERIRDEEIRKQGPYIGMGVWDLLHCSWGKPKNVHKTTTAYGVSEQWCYGGYKYVYVENGIVTAVQR